MGLIEDIESAFNNSLLKNPIVELRLESDSLIFGYISSNSFENKNDEECQRIIWEILDNNFSKEELIKITAIFHETPIERLKRKNKNQISDKVNSKSCYHETPLKDKYWIFVDVKKLDNEDYKTIFIIFNEKLNFKKLRSYLYPKSVLEWMEYGENEIYYDLFNEVFEAAKTEVEINIIQRYDKYHDKGIADNTNIFNYVFSNFKLNPMDLNRVLFTRKEMTLVQKLLDKIIDFNIYNDFIRIIKNSVLFNNEKKDIV